MRYKEGDVIMTRFFHRDSGSGPSPYVRATIQEVLPDDDSYGVVFLDTMQHKWISSKLVDRLSKPFDPGSGPPRKLKFLT